MSPRGSLLPRWRIWNTRIFTACDKVRLLLVWPGMLLLFAPQVPKETKTRIVELT